MLKMEKDSKESYNAEPNSAASETNHRKRHYSETETTSCKKLCLNIKNGLTVNGAYSGHRKDNCVLVQKETGHSRIHINSLPYSILLEVCSWLLMSDLLHSVSFVCKYWNDVARDPKLWKHLTLHRQTKLTDVILLRLTQISNRIVSLDISDTKLITSQGFLSAMKQCSNIAILKLVRCHYLNEDCFTFVGTSCSKLEKAYFDGCSAVSDASLKAIGNGCSNLTLLSLSQCPNVTDKGIAAISNECRRLKDLQLNDCKKVTNGCMGPLVKICSHLEVLNISSCNFTDDALSQLEKFKSLKTLEVASCGSITDDLLIALSQHCRLLDTLNINLCQKVTDKAIDQIARRATHLRNLTMVACQVTDKGLMSLGNHCKKLEYIDAGWCEAVTESGAFYVSSLCKELKYFGLMRCDQLSVSACDKLVKEFPHVRFSTMWLDYQRLLARAHSEGLLPGVHTEKTSWKP